jgi:ABC-2 type transport system permease protein
VSARRSSPASPWKRRAELPLLATASLAVVDLFRAPLGVLGVEFAKFRAILANRLWIETRPAGSTTSAMSSPAAGLALTGAMAALTGLGAGIVALSSRDPKPWLLAGLGLWMFWLALLTLGHFAALLVDSADIAVLVGVPVRDRTVLAARIAHVAIYTLVLTICASVAPIALGCIVFPPWIVLLVYPLGALLTSLLVVASVGVVFGLCLRIFGAAKFERATFWVQVCGGGMLMLAVQVVPHFMRWSELFAFAQESAVVRACWPPLHFHALYNLLAGAPQPGDAGLAALGVLAPLGTLALALWLSRGRYIAALADTGVQASGRRRGFGAGWLARFGLRTCSRGAARSAFGWAFALTRRERTFLRGVGPQVVMFLTLAVLAVAAPSRQAGALETTFAPLALYGLGVAMTSAYFVAEYSEHSRAVVVFDALPLGSSRAFLEGAAKALLLGVAAPITGAGALALSILSGPSAWLEIALALVAILYLDTVFARKLVRDMPFSRAPGASPSGEQMAWMFATVFASGILVALHLLLRLHPLATLGGVLFFAWRLREAWRALEHIQPERGSILRRLSSTN